MTAWNSGVRRLWDWSKQWARSSTISRIWLAPGCGQRHALDLLVLATIQCCSTLLNADTEDQWNDLPNFTLVASDWDKIRPKCFLSSQLGCRLTTAWDITRETLKRMGIKSEETTHDLNWTRGAGHSQAKEHEIALHEFRVFERMLKQTSNFSFKLLFETFAKHCNRKRMGCSLQSIRCFTNVGRFW